jgi:hypothetical protein
VKRWYCTVTGIIPFPLTLVLVLEPPKWGWNHRDWGVSPRTMRATNNATNALQPRELYIKTLLTLSAVGPEVPFVGVAPSSKSQRSACDPARLHVHVGQSRQRSLLR